MKVTEIIAVIEDIAPVSFQAAWDASGVQVASFAKEASHIAVMLDPSPLSVGQALAAGADFLLSHHPLAMQPRFPNRQDDYLSVLSLLFTHKAWLYSAHTSLDANPAGPVRWLAEALGLESVEILEISSPVSGGASQYGFGFTGTLPQELGYAEFCRVLSGALGKKDWQACGPAPERVHRVACCPGSGGSMYPEALAAGADVFVTGDVKYHTALDASAAGLRVLDVGHFALEEEMMRRMALYLEQALTIPVTFVAGADPLGGEYAPQS